ncbi:hypothetical protein EVAR_82848_1 [Eumeta japonica]|uniref:Uncharacterized protein n=1 Tax=Eumeta variegata TaxID=151549 RepID=A0A4C1V392_EUMVA|nr:hypothetical protein EVAR_82848_1 [Eumeta japonica]
MAKEKMAIPSIENMRFKGPKRRSTCELNKHAGNAKKNKTRRDGFNSWRPYVTESAAARALRRYFLLARRPRHTRRRPAAAAPYNSRSTLACWSCSTMHLELRGSETPASAAAARQTADVGLLFIDNRSHDYGASVHLGEHFKPLVPVAVTAPLAAVGGSDPRRADAQDEVQVTQSKIKRLLESVPQQWDGLTEPCRKTQPKELELVYTLASFSGAAGKLPTQLCEKTRVAAASHDVTKCNSAALTAAPLAPVRLTAAPLQRR